MLSAEKVTKKKIERIDCYASSARRERRRKLGTTERVHCQQRQTERGKNSCLQKLSMTERRKGKKTDSSASSSETEEELVS